MNNTQGVIEGIQTLVGFYAELLREKRWLRAKEGLESVFSNDRSSLEVRRSAISEAMSRALRSEHWMVICGRIMQDYLLLGQEMTQHFFKCCDKDALVWFATDEKSGLIPMTLEEISSADNFDGSISHKVQLFLLAVRQLANHNKDFIPVVVALVRVLKCYCEFLGSNNREFKEQFDAILGKPQEVRLPMLAPAKTAVVAPTTLTKSSQPKGAPKGKNPNGTMAMAFRNFVEKNAAKETAATA